MMQFSLEDFLPNIIEDVGCFDSTKLEHGLQTVTDDSALGIDGMLEDEERKTRRRVANRESARRTRQRKADMLKTLSAEVTRLSKRNVWLQTRAAEVAKQYAQAKIENEILRQQVQELSMDITPQIQDLGPMRGLNQQDPYLRHCSMSQLSPALDFFPTCSAFPPSGNPSGMYLPLMNTEPPKLALPPLCSSPMLNTPHSQSDTPHSHMNNFSAFPQVARAATSHLASPHLSIPSAVDDDNQWSW